METTAVKTTGNWIVMTGSGVRFDGVRDAVVDAEGNLHYTGKPYLPEGR